MDAKTFDLLGAIRGRTYPEDSVSVYTDLATIYQIDLLNAQANAATTDAETLRLEAEIKGLGADVERTRLVFFMRGFPSETATEIREAEVGSKLELTDQEVIQVSLATLAASITKVEDAEGNQTTAPSKSDLELIRTMLPETEFQKLLDLTWDLSFRSLTYDAEITTDFSQKS